MGIVSDNPDQKIKLKMFHCEIQNDHKAIAEEERNYKPIPSVENVTYADIIENYIGIKHDIEFIRNSGNVFYMNDRANKMLNNFVINCLL